MYNYEDIAKILSLFSYPKQKENKMKPWKRHVLTTYTGIQFVNTADSYDIYTIWILNYLLSSRPNFCMFTAQGPNRYGTLFQDQHLFDPDQNLVWYDVDIYTGPLNHFPIAQHLPTQQEISL